MTNKFNSAEAIIKNGGNCIGVVNNCPNCCLEGRCSVAIKHYSDNEYDLKLAIEYKKEHEMKGKVIAEWQPVKGERVLAKIGMSEEYQEVIFDEKVESTIETIYCHEKNRTNLSVVSCIRQIKPKYKAYTEPKIEWIGKDILRVSDKRELTICSIEKGDFDNYVLGITDLGRCTLDYLFEITTWLDGSPFGKEIR